MPEAASAPVLAAALALLACSALAAVAIPGSTGEPAGPERDVAARVGRGRTRHAHISLPPLRILLVHVGIIVQHIPRRIGSESVHRGDHRALGDPVGELYLAVACQFDWVRLPTMS